MTGAESGDESMLLRDRHASQEVWTHEPSWRGASASDGQRRAACDAGGVLRRLRERSAVDRQQLMCCAKQRPMGTPCRRSDLKQNKGPSLQGWPAHTRDDMGAALAIFSLSSALFCTPARHRVDETSCLKYMYLILSRQAKC